MRIPGSIVIVLCAGLLAACAEKPQTSGTRKADSHAFEGTGAPAYAAPGWKAGDAASWEQQLKTRAQGQNEYSRTSAP